eukprot:3933103-Pyramimonas_sp.AAC.1
MQGRPAPGALYSMASHPCTQHLRSSIAPQGRREVKACADDVGACVSQITVLRLLAAVFRAARRVAPLGL